MHSTAPELCCGHWPSTAAVAVLGCVLGANESQAQHLVMINSVTTLQVLFGKVCAIQGIAFCSPSQPVSAACLLRGSAETAVLGVSLLGAGFRCVHRTKGGYSHNISHQKELVA